MNWNENCIQTSKFYCCKIQSKTSNKNGAQIVFTTHNIELMNLELRKIQFYFVDKYDKDGTSELYTVSVILKHEIEMFEKHILLKVWSYARILKLRRWNKCSSPLIKQKAIYYCFYEGKWASIYRRKGSLKMLHQLNAQVLLVFRIAG